MRSTEELRRFFAQADWSATDFSESHPSLADWALALLGRLPGRRILDLGCGSASLGVELAVRGFVVTCLDLHAEPARQRCTARGVNLELLEQDMRQLDRPGSFDAVINWDVSGLGMLGEKDDCEVIHRVADALVPGGKFLVQSYSVAYAQSRRMEGLTWDAARRQLRGRIRGCDLAVRLYSPAEWMGMLEACGLYPMNLCPPQADRSVREEKMITLVAEKCPEASAAQADSVRDNKR